MEGNAVEDRTPGGQETASRSALFLTTKDMNRLGAGGQRYSVGVVQLIRKSGFFDRIEAESTRARPDQPTSRQERLFHLGRSMFSSLPEKAFAGVSPSRMRAIGQAMAGSHAAYLFDNCETLWLMDRFPVSGARVLVSHSIEHLLWRDRVETDTRFPFWLRPILRRDVAKLKHLETDGVRRAGNLWINSLTEAEWFREVTPDLNLVVVPPIFGELEDLPDLPAIPSKPLRLGFLGTMSWWPNAEGLDWLIDSVLPGLDPAAIELHVFGGGSESYSDRRANVFGHGFVDDINDVWNSIDVVACPIFSGAGINVKFAEARFRGKPMLATNFAARGLPEASGDALLLMDSAEEWIEFLKSSALEEFALSRPSESARRRYADSSYLDDVYSFFDRAVNGA